MKRFFAQLLAVFAAFGAVAAVSIGWVIHLRVRPDFDGWTPGPMMLGVPVVLVVLTIIWLLARALLGKRMRWSLAALLVASTAFAYAVVAVMCGPVACFQPGSNRLLGWFITGGVALAALTHHLVRERLRTTWIV